MLLRAFLWSPWSHCAIVDGDEVVEAAAWYGVRSRLLEEFLAASSLYEIIRIPCNDPEVAIAAARSQIGKPYDWAGVFGIWFRRNWQNEDHYMCSELVAWAQAQSGPALFRTKASRITPRDISLPIFVIESCERSTAT